MAGNGTKFGIKSRGDAAHRLAAAIMVIAAWAVSSTLDVPPGVEAAATTLLAFPLGIWLRKSTDAKQSAQAAVDLEQDVSGL